MKYRVIALSVGGLGNKIFASQDIVSAENFPEGHADLLVAKGFLEVIQDEKAKKVGAKKAGQELVFEGPEDKKQA